MAAKNQGGLTRNVPILTLSMVAASVAVFLVPGVHAALVYDRAAILKGELWRLTTGPWVHFSTSHFFYDTLVLGIAGSVIESRAYPKFGWLCALTPLVTGLATLALQPHLEICGGLSGLATAAVTFLAVHGLEEKGAWRWICLMALLATSGKIAMEMTTGRFVFVQPGATSFAPVPSVHIMGALVALAVYAWNKVQKRARLG